MANGNEPHMAPEGNKGYFQSIINTMMQVITNPVEFFKEMPRSGGFPDPIIFLIIMGVINGIIHVILTLVGLSDVAATPGSVFFSFFIIPILMLVFGFVVAGIWFVIWKLLGSEEEFEVAFRCIAYTSAISVITSFFNVIPYIGSILGLAWTMYLLVIASTEVHQIESKKAWLVLAIIFAFFALTSTCSQYQTRRMERHATEFSEKFGKKMEDMTPEEAGRAVGEFLKGMKDTVEPEKK